MQPTQQQDRPPQSRRARSWRSWRWAWGSRRGWGRRGGGRSGRRELSKTSSFWGLGRCFSAESWAMMSQRKLRLLPSQLTRPRCCMEPNWANIELVKSKSYATYRREYIHRRTIIRWSIYRVNLQDKWGDETEGMDSLSREDKDIKGLKLCSLLQNMNLSFTCAAKVHCWGEH